MYRGEGGHTSMKSSPPQLSNTGQIGPSSQPQDWVVGSTGPRAQDRARGGRGEGLGWGRSIAGVSTGLVTGARGAIAAAALIILVLKARAVAGAGAAGSLGLAALPILLLIVLVIVLPRARVVVVAAEDLLLVPGCPLVLLAAPGPRLILAASGLCLPLALAALLPLLVCRGMERQV